MNTTSLRDQYTKLAKQLGLNVPALAKATAADYNPGFDDHYPLTLSRSASLLDKSIGRASAQDKSVDLIDFASLTILAAASQARLDEFDGVNSKELDARMGYAVLHWLRTHDDSCATTLSFAHLTSISQNAGARVILGESRPVRAACESDPTALWFLGQVTTRISLEFDDAVPMGWLSTNLPHARLFDLDAGESAEEFFSLLRTEYPALAAGYAGTANMWLHRAANGETQGYRPFTTAHQWEEAAKWAEQARSRASEPGTLDAWYMHIRCKTGSCPHDEISEDLVSIPTSRQQYGVLAGALLRGGDAMKAATLMRKAPPARVGRAISSAPWNAGKDDATIGAEASQVMTFFPHAPAGGFQTEDWGFLPVANVPLPSPWGKWEGSLYQRLLEPDPRQGNPKYWQIQAHRIGDNLDKALEVGLAWAKQDDSSSAWYQLSEIQLLLGRHREAVQSIDKFAERASEFDRHGEVPGMPSRADLATLRRITSLRALGEYDKIGQVTMGLANHAEIPQVRYYATLELGQIFFEQKAYGRANAAFESAVKLTKKHPKIKFSGSAHNNSALAHLKLNNYDQAVRQAKAALAIDPHSPVFTETLAQAQRGNPQAAPPSGGSPTTATPSASVATSPTSVPSESATPDEPDGCAAMKPAMDTYRQALKLDTTMEQSWNNLGVMLAQCGQIDEARQAFKTAVSHQPGYATAWFNFGSLLQMRGSWSDILVAQGALGIASQLDPGLRGEAPALIFDEAINESGLDLSKPLKAGWTMSQHPRPTTVPFTILLFLIVGWRAVEALTREIAVAKGLERVLSPVTGSTFFKWLGTLLPSYVGIVVSVIVLAMLTGAEGQRERWLILPLAMAIATIPILATPPRPLHRRNATPSGAFVGTLLAAPFGVAFPPMAGSRSRLLGWKRRILAPLLGALLLLAFVGVTAATKVPFSRTAVTLTAAALGAMSLPVHPYDGSRLSRWTSLALTVLLLTIAVVLATQWV